MTWCSRCASAREAFDGYASRRRKPVSQCESIQAFLEAPRKVVLPALGGQATLFADLLHGHAQDQHLMDQRRAVRSQLMLYPVEPHDRPPLCFRDGLTRLAAIDALARRIDRARTAFRPLPIVLERAAAAILCFVDLAMRVQFGQGIAASRT